MTTEDKALIERLRQRSNSNYMLMSYPQKPAPDRDCHAVADLLEQLLPIAQEFDDFQQEVSDAVKSYFHPFDIPLVFQDFISPKPKPDPLEDVLEDICIAPHHAKIIRAALDALGFEIREKGQ